MSGSIEGRQAWNGVWIRVCLLGCLLLPPPGAQAFLPNFWSRVLTLSWGSHTHQHITEQALLNVTLETLSGLPPHHLPDAQLGAELGRGFWRAVGEVVRSNAAMDFLSSTRSEPVYHFDSEKVEGAVDVLRQLWAHILFSVRARDYPGARANLGRLLHSLQDFYSHSNWVEMGQTSIYLHLLHPGQPAIPVAPEDTPTCIECYGATCRNNILPRLRQTQHAPLLTTGYFSSYPAKPAGKCSHGGLLDSSRHQGARGGINKDSTSPLFSPHHYLHDNAARLATAATMTVLQDLRDAVGTSSFLRLLSVRQQPALVFVMDTTGSMFEEITAARLRALSIIQARAKTTQQPGTYLLVPFHDPVVGPVYETEDPDQFMRYLEELTALGGGDEPEMCLSAVQLALTHSAPLSEIFVFTDASPKDAHLYSAVEALTLEKQSKVSFLLTEDPGSIGRDRGMRKKRESLSPDRFSLYSYLSSVSGGLTIFSTNSDIYRVSAIIQDNLSASKVTLLHVESDTVTVSTNFPFGIDSTVKSVTLHLTGAIKHCVLMSPSGQTESLLDQTGTLADMERWQGLYRVNLLPPMEPGQWQLSADTEGPITLSAIGDSSVDFLYYFAVVANGTHPGLARVEGSPVAGVPTFLVLAVTGLSPNEEASFSHVTLLGANGESLLKVPLNSTSSCCGKELVGSMTSMPREPFCVRLSGRDAAGNSLDRVSTEMIQPTHVQIQVLSVPHLVPGHASVVIFDLWNHGPSRHFTLSAADDHGFLTEREPHRLSVGERGSLRGQVEVKTPGGTEPGGVVTLTLTVRALDSVDANYAVVHLNVVSQDPDITPPSCSPMHVEAACPPLCGQARWTVSLVVRDRGCSGLAALQLSEGPGILTLLSGLSGKPWQQEGESGENESAGRWDPQGGQGLEKPRLLQGDPPLNILDRGAGVALRVRYTASCCSPQAELLAWDTAGNMRRCHLTSSQQGPKYNTSNVAGRTGLVLFTLLSGLLLGAGLMM